MSTYADDNSSLADMRESLERIASKLQGATGKVGDRSDDLIDVQHQVAEALRLLPPEGEPDADAQHLYNATLDLYQAFCDVLAVDGIHGAAASLYAANGKLVDTLTQEIKDLKSATGPGDFISKLGKAVKDTLESLFGGAGMVIGGALVILVIYLYVKGRK